MGGGRLDDQVGHNLSQKMKLERLLDADAKRGLIVLFQIQFKMFLLEI